MIGNHLINIKNYALYSDNRIHDTISTAFIGGSDPCTSPKLNLLCKKLTQGKTQKKPDKV